jgi:predicted nucleic acid-binding protein
VKLLLDVNVVLDVALRREPWAHAAAALLSAIDEGRATGFVAAHTVTTFFYVVARIVGREGAIRATADLLRIVQVVPSDDTDFRDALAMNLRDFEDAVQAVAALRIEADYLVTRNGVDFRSTGIPFRTAGEILAVL